MEEAANTGLLLAFRDRQAEKEWRLRWNSAMTTMDVLWHLGINAVAGKFLLVRRSATGTLPQFAAVFLLPSVALIVMQTCWRRAYVRRRIPLILALRATREVSVAIIFMPFQTELWPPAAPPEGASCAAFVLSSQVAIVFYLFSRVVAFPLPLSITVWMVAESAAIMLYRVPGRCVVDTGLTPAAAACAQAWEEALGAFGRFWPFSTGQAPFGGGALQPWEACTVVRATLMLVAGALVPLLLCSTLEEKWRHDWLAWRQRDRAAAPVTPTMLTRLLFDAALVVLGTTICYHAVSLVIEGPLVPVAGEALAAAFPWR